MHPVCGDKCFTRPTVHVWCQKFARGQENVDEIAAVESRTV